MQIYMNHRDTIDSRNMHWSIVIKYGKPEGH